MKVSSVMIHVENVRKSFGALCVLQAASLEVERGEVAVLLGPSGSGKSTLLRCINGLDTFQAGKVRVGDLSFGAEGVDADRAATLQRVRKTVGMVFQGFHLFPHLSVLRNITEAPIQVKGEPRAEAEANAVELLDRVGLKDKMASRPDQLSGGQRQRVAIARTLAMRPEAILFDEPTSALDPRMTAEVLAVMADLARSGQTMIVVTHAMRFARLAASVVHVLGSGRIQESGPPDQIFDHPQTQAARHFLSEVQGSGQD